MALNMEKKTAELKFDLMNKQHRSSHTHINIYLQIMYINLNVLIK